MLNLSNTNSKSIVHKKLFKINNKTTDKILNINIDDITPIFNVKNSNIDDMIFSIENFSLISPIIVFYKLGRYYIIDGNKRYFACKNLNITNIPIINKQLDEFEAYSIIINKISNDNTIHFIHKSEMIKSFLEKFNLNIKELYNLTTYNYEALVEYERYFHLNSEIKESIIKNNISPDQVKTSLTIKNQNYIFKFFNHISSEKLNDYQAQLLADQINHNFLKQNVKSYLPKDIRLFEKTIDNTVEQMKQTGFNVICNKKNENNSLNYDISVCLKQ